MPSAAFLGVESDVWVPLLAAFLGASGAGVYNYRLKRREERRELRALVRLVRNELREARGILSGLSQVTVGSELLTYSSVYTPDDRVWRDQQVVLGRHLKTASEWDRIRVAYRRMGFVRLVAQRRPEGTLGWIEATVHTIDDAIAVCERHAGRLGSYAADTPEELEHGAFVLWQQNAKAELQGSRNARTPGPEEAR